MILAHSLHSMKSIKSGKRRKPPKDRGLSAAPAPAYPRSEYVDGYPRIDHYPSNYPYPVAGTTPGSYTTQDHVVTFDLPPDPAFNTGFNAAAPATAAAADQVPTAPVVGATVGQQAQNNRDYVTQQLSLVEIAKGPQYDFGRGTNRRNDFYRTAGLGGNMQGIMNLNRPSLGFDILGAIEQGAKAGYAKYAAEAPVVRSGGPSVSVTNPLAGVLPDWLVKAQLPTSVRDIGGGILSSVTKAATAKPATNPNAVVGTTVASAPRPASSTNWLLWGGVGIVGIFALKRALK